MAAQHFVSERDGDIELLLRLDKIVRRISGAVLVVTGSYAIEAITNKRYEKHDDIDVNIFATNLKTCMIDLSDALSNPAMSSVLVPYKHTQDRLEYSILPPIASHAHRMLEIQFYDMLPSESAMILIQKGEGGPYKVPIQASCLKDSAQKSHCFNTKTLCYLIATWCIRISGGALNPKREVRPSDIDHLGALINVYKGDGLDIIACILGHSQKPTAMSSEQIFSIALKVAKLQPQF